MRNLGDSPAMALSTKMRQYDQYETIRTFGNVHWERSSRAKSREYALIDNVFGTSCYKKHIVSNILVDSPVVLEHILLQKL